jgi:Tol biopolymer transport system component
MLSALRLDPGNPPRRSLVTVAEDGALRRSVHLDLPRGIRLVSFTRSRDGSRILLTAARSSSDDQATDVFSFRADGSERHQLTTNGASGTPVPSPDDRLIAYGVARWGNHRSAGIWLMDARGHHQRRLVAGADDVLDFPGAWSPDGRHLAFTRCHVRPYTGPASEDHCAIYVVARDGRDVHKIADGALLPDWSPDGTQIVFMSTRDHTHTITAGSDTSRYAAELYLMDADGGHQRRLTTTPSLEESFPRWSPGGSRIAYERRGDAFRTRLFQVNADGTCPTAITPAHGSSWFSLPIWNASSDSPEPPLRCPGS